MGIAETEMKKIIKLINRKFRVPEARSTFFGCTGSNPRFLDFFISSMKFRSTEYNHALSMLEIWDFCRMMISMGKCSIGLQRPQN
jgi:hypothetical protein